MKFTLPFLAVCALPTVLAHFTLDYPQTRGFDEDIEPQFCGGFNSTSSTRAPFPLNSAGSILIDSHHPSAQVAVLISFNENPTSIGQFTRLDNGTDYGLLMGFKDINGEGEFCFDVNVASLNLGATNGTRATLQVEFNGGDGTLFQCSDVILVSDYTTPSNVTSACQQASSVSASGSTSGGSATRTSTGSSVSATPSSGGTSGGGRVGVEYVVGALGLVGAVGILFLN
ncbi:hypothetical protein JCM5353_000633 [Sporobolomyces roseus]